MKEEFKEKYIKKQNDKKSISITPQFPKIIKIDICNVCNYACVFCPQSKQDKKRGMIDETLCKRILLESYCEGAREVCFSSTGEPLLNRKLEEYIVYAKKIGYEYIFFNTNGFLMDYERSKEIIKSGVDSIKFSINAGDQLSYQLVHGIDGYEKVIENLINLSMIRDKMESNCKIYVSYVAIKQTLKEVSELKNRIEQYVDDFVVMNANRRGGSISEIDQDLYIGKDEYSFEYPCSQLFNNLYVTSEGYVNICAQDFENLTVVADLNEMSVKEAWTSEKFTSFRKKYLKKELIGTLCNNCIYNCNNKVVPLDEEKAYYHESLKKISDLETRIKILSERG